MGNYKRPGVEKKMEKSVYFFFAGGTNEITGVFDGLREKNIKLVA